MNVKAMLNRGTDKFLISMEQLSNFRQFLAIDWNWLKKNSAKRGMKTELIELDRKVPGEAAQMLPFL